MNTLINSLISFDFVSCKQPFSAEIVAALKRAAKANQVPLDVEIIMRLLAVLLDPGAFGKKKCCV